jgi:lysophospholipase L1-like esterase
MQFRNSGIGGNTTGSVLARFDYDVAAWKPTIVSIELAMNDVGAGDNPEKYIKGMRELIKRIRAIPATPVLISSSPVNDGSIQGKWTSDRCRRIDAYTNALKAMAAEEKLVVADQYHPLLELWGKNNPAIAAATTNPSAAPGAVVPPKSTGKIQLHGDAVHPGAVGQYTMAATILSALSVDREVSSATLKANGSVVESKKCKISEASAKDGRITFTRLDECGPWPIDPKAKEALDLMPAMADLSRYMLKVEGLPAGQYAVSIDGKPAATVSEKELAAGWNMSTVMQGALADRSTKIIGQISALQSKLNTEWRAASKEKNEEKLKAAQAAIETAEKELQAACQPTAMKFEIALTK